MHFHFSLSHYLQIRSCSSSSPQPRVRNPSAWRAYISQYPRQRATLWRLDTRFDSIRMRMLLAGQFTFYATALVGNFNTITHLYSQLPVRTHILHDLWIGLWDKWIPFLQVVHPHVIILKKDIAWKKSVDLVGGRWERETRELVPLGTFAHSRNVTQSLW